MNVSLLQVGKNARAREHAWAATKETIEYCSAVLWLWLLYVRWHRLGMQRNWIKNAYLAGWKSNCDQINLILSHIVSSIAWAAVAIRSIFVYCCWHGFTSLVDRSLIFSSRFYFPLCRAFAGTVRGANKAKCWPLCETQPKCIASANRTHAISPTTARSARVYFIERFVCLWVWICSERTRTWVSHSPTQ